MLNESIEEFRTYLNCELADLEMFKTVVKISKLQLEELVIMITEVGKTFFNGRLKKERITALHDTRNLKMIRNRLGGLLSIHSSEVLRNHSFFKAKSLARNKV